MRDFGDTVGLLLILGIGTYFLLPKITEFLLTLIQAVNLFAMLLEPMIANILPIENWNSAFEALGQNYMITSLEVAKMTISSAISWFVVSITLPLRSICFTLWYKQLSIAEIKSKKKGAKTKDV